MSKINGVLLPGGATYLNQSAGYAEAGRHIYDIAMKLNERGIYMPLWGTCLGFELMVILTANGTDVRTDCASSAQALPLEFKQGYDSSRLFSPEVLKIHIFCYAEEVRNRARLGWS